MKQGLVPVATAALSITHFFLRGFSDLPFVILSHSIAKNKQGSVRVPDGVTLDKSEQRTAR